MLMKSLRKLVLTTIDIDSYDLTAEDIKLSRSRCDLVGSVLAY